MGTLNDIKLLVVEVDDELRGTMARRLDRAGIQVQEVARSEQALEIAQRHDFDVAIINLAMPGMAGMQLLERLKEAQQECEVILLASEATVQIAAQAIGRSAYDFLIKPFPLQDLETLIEKADERRRLRKENRQLKELIQRSRPQFRMIGQSPAMQKVRRLVERAGPSEKAILIQGESGTGKELLAQALHRASQRAEGPLVSIHCTPLPESLLESELFGHEKGAFTGEISEKQGLLEVAEGGTLFIDEIGELPAPLQAKLLQVLEHGSLRRVGSVKPRKVDVRLLAATNRRLADEVAAGRFREDLYYRMNVMSLELPPLRERRDDIPLLVAHFLGPDWEIEPAAEKLLYEEDWPGNVRQLIKALARAKILSDDWTIRAQNLPRDMLAAHRQHAPSDAGEPDDLSQLERAKILEVLRRERGNKSRAARALGIDRRKLYRLVEKYGIKL